MSDDNSTLAAIPRHVEVTLTTGFQKMSTLIAAALSILESQIFWLDYCKAKVPASESFTFNFSDPTAAGVADWDSAGVDYSTDRTDRAKCVMNTSNMWIKGSGAIVVQCIVYIET